MNYSICPRCEAQEFAKGHSVCMNCNYGLDSDAGNGVSIPAWVLKYVEVTPAELAEIREINFGFPSGRISQPPATPKIQNSVKEAATPVVGKPLAIPFRRRSRLEPTEILETGQCVM